MFLKCAQLIGVKFTEHAKILVFEDSTHGLEAAVSAGMFPVGVQTQHDAETLVKAGAKKACLHIKDAMDRGWLRDC
jgi:beta-phosphoglucomutase-like phosphatase (HAD superfamily)